MKLDSALICAAGVEAINMFGLTSNACKQLKFKYGKITCVSTGDNCACTGQDFTYNVKTNTLNEELKGLTITPAQYLHNVDSCLSVAIRDGIVSLDAKNDQCLITLNYTPVAEPDESTTIVESLSLKSHFSIPLDDMLRRMRVCVSMLGDYKQDGKEIKVVYKGVANGKSYCSFNYGGIFKQWKFNQPTFPITKDEADKWLKCEFLYPEYMSTSVIPPQGAKKHECHVSLPRRAQPNKQPNQQQNQQRAWPLDNLPNLDEVRKTLDEDWCKPKKVATVDNLSVTVVSDAKAETCTVSSSGKSVTFPFGQIPLADSEILEKIRD